MKVNLGRRILFFRKRTGISQQELELGIGVSPGVISRIENNFVNPTKETLLNISNVLNLNSHEIDYLVGQTALPSTESEIKAALLEAKSILENEQSFAHLLDERWRFVALSNSLIKLLRLNDSEVKYFQGKTTTQSIVEVDSPLYKRLDMDFYDELLKMYLHSYYSWMSYMFDDGIYQDTLSSIKANPRAVKVWASLSDDKKYFTDAENRVVHFNFSGSKITLGYSALPLIKNTRFYFVEWYAENKISKIQ